MYDGGKIIFGLIIGVVMLTFPFWYNLGAAGPKPDIKMPVKEKQCPNPVQEHMMLGKLMGVVTTPSIILNDGKMLPGYVPADKLGDLLDQKQKQRR